MKETLIKAEAIKNYLSKDLKPCPFCGGKAKLRMVSRGYDADSRTRLVNQFRVYCTECDVGTPTFASNIWQAEDGTVHIVKNGAELAVEAWSRRTK